MILFDALHINDSGGKILLNYLIETIEKYDLKVTYILDIRVKDSHAKIDSNKVHYIKSNFRNRLIFYVRNKSRFQKVFCFGNIPPPVGVKAIS